MIAFSLVGSFVGVAIGGSIDPAEKNKIPGEMHLDISTGGTIGFFTGIIGGTYIGYRLAKRDAKKVNSKQLHDAEGRKTVFLGEPDIYQLAINVALITVCLVGK
ncbi:hypothetical protein KAR48_12890 [bacterium]|nr:hypothetical protein [bacterium]